MEGKHAGKRFGTGRGGAGNKRYGGNAALGEIQERRCPSGCVQFSRSGVYPPQPAAERIGGEIGKRRERRGTETCRRDLCRPTRESPSIRRTEARKTLRRRFPTSSGRKSSRNIFPRSETRRQRSGGGRFVRGRSQSARENAGRSRQTGGRNSLKNLFRENKIYGNNDKRGQRVKERLPRRGVRTTRHRHQPAARKNTEIDGGRVGQRGAAASRSTA